MKHKTFVVITLFLSLLLIMTGCSQNNAFTLHNETKFMSTVSDVLSIEQKNGCLMEKTVPDSNPCRIGETGTYVGREDTDMYYSFDNDGKLIHFHYYFDEVDSKAYDALNDSLAKKYGAPGYSSENGTSIPVNTIWYPKDYNELPNIWNGDSPITGKSIDGTSYTGGRMDVFGTVTYRFFDYTCKDYSQWLLKQGDGSAVLIDHCKIRLHAYTALANRQNRSLESDKAYELLIYTYLSPAEYTKIQNTMTQAMKDI